MLETNGYALQEALEALAGTVRADALERGSQRDRDRAVQTLLKRLSMIHMAFAAVHEKTPKRRRRKAAPEASA